MPAPLDHEFETCARQKKLCQRRVDVEGEVNRLLKANQLSVGGPSSFTQVKEIFEAGPRIAGTVLLLNHLWSKQCRPPMLKAESTVPP